MMAGLCYQGQSTVMRPGSGVHQVRFSQVFGQKAWDQLCQKNATLKQIDFPSRQVDITLSEPAGQPEFRQQNRLRDRAIRIFRPFIRFLRRPRQKRPNVGQQLFNVYASFLSNDKLTVDGVGAVLSPDKINLNRPGHLKLACAFVAAGVCRWGKGGKLESTEQVIDKSMVDRVDVLVNGSCTRLAYEFIALDKTLPKGFLEHIFIPHFLASIVNQTGMSEIEARGVLNDILASPAVSISRETDITLEHVMELKNRLAQMGLWQFESVVPATSDTRSGESITRPRLPVPNPCYQCDEEDLWLIQYQVEHHRFLKFASDFAHRIRHWVQRNKRIIGLDVAETITVATVTGITTGGIGLAAYLSSRVIFKMIQVGVGGAITAIRSALSRRKVSGVEAGIEQQLSEGASQSFDSREIKDIAALDNTVETNPHRNIKRLLEGTEFLARKRSLTNMTNLLLDMKTLSADLDRLESRAGDSVANSIRLQRLYAVASQHSARFEEAAQNYDKMVVAGVQKVSELNGRFERLFKPLWKHFCDLSDDQISDIFNEAANKSSVNGRWYLPREDCLHWIQTIVPEEPGNPSSCVIRERVGQAIAGRDAARNKVNVWSSKTHRKVAKVILFGRDVVFSYAWGRIRPYRMVAQALEVMDYDWAKGTRPGIDLIKPVITPLWAGVAVFLYVVDRFTRYINNKWNCRRSHDVQSRVNMPDADAQQGTRKPEDVPLSVDDWQAIRRQAKHMGVKYVKTVKQLIKVLDALSDQATVTPPADRDSPEYRACLVRIATDMLRYKKLMHDMETQMYSSVGLMHHLGLTHRFRFDRRVRCIRIAE